LVIMQNRFEEAKGLNDNVFVTFTLNKVINSRASEGVSVGIAKENFALGKLLDLKNWKHAG